MKKESLAPQFLAEQLILSQPGGWGGGRQTDYAQPCPSPAPWISPTSIVVLYFTRFRINGLTTCFHEFSITTKLRSVERIQRHLDVLSQVSPWDSKSGWVRPSGLNWGWLDQKMGPISGSSQKPTMIGKNYPSIPNQLCRT